MSRCVNNKCDKIAVDSLNRMCVTADGDFACDEQCKSEYEKQRDYFFSVTCQSEALTTNYLMGL